MGTVADGRGHAGRSGALRPGRDRTACHLSLSLSLSNFNCVSVCVCVSPSPHLLISPRLVASSPPAGVKEVKKRSERRLVLFDRRAVSRVEAAWNNAAAEVGGGIRRRDYHPSTCWIMSISHGAFTSVWDRL